MDFTNADRGDVKSEVQQKVRCLSSLSNRASPQDTAVVTHNVGVEPLLAVLHDCDANVQALGNAVLRLGRLSQGQRALLDLREAVALRPQHVDPEVPEAALHYPYL